MSMNLIRSPYPVVGGGFSGPDFPLIGTEWARYEAFREIGYSDGEGVVPATDQSGNGRHWGSTGDAPSLPQWQGNQINGLAVYNGSHGSNAGWDVGPDMSALTAVHAFMVFLAKDDPAVTLGDTGLWNVGTDSLSAHVPYVDGNIYDDAFSTTRRSANPTINLAADYVLYEVISTSTEWTLKLNGTETVITTGTNTVSGPVAPLLLIASGAIGRHKMAHFSIFSAELTTERASVISYLNHADIFNKGWS